MPPQLDFRLLGPLEVRDGARALPLGGHKQRSLLAILLLHRNQVVAGDALIDGLWGESAPKTAGTALRVYVSALRKLVSAERLETRAPGYVLHVEPEELDLGRFDRLCAEAREREPEAAAAALDEALGLWRGEPLADFAYDSFAQSEIARLEELRLGAVEQRIEADLALGKHAELVGELEGLVAKHPLRERLREQLILALYRSRRQAEALEAYRQARQVLVEELGLEPSPALRELEKAILSQDAALEPPPAAAAPPSEDAEPPAPAAPAPREERKRVSVLFAELDGLQGSAEADPEDLRAALAPYQARIKEEIERFGGTVERFVGETVLAFFGAPLAHEDDAERAVRAALRLSEALDEIGPKEPRFAVRAAVATGDAVVSVEEAGSEVVGEVVTTASKLKEAAMPGGVVVSPLTYRATKEVVDYEELEPPESWRAIRAHSTLQPEQPEAGTPFIGRKDELALLEQTFARTAREASVQLVTVTGEPGIGKSRLVHELRASLERQSVHVLWRQGRCLSYGEGITFWALGELVRAHAGIHESDGREQAAAKLAAAVEAAVADRSEHEWFQSNLAPLVGATPVSAVAVERSESFAAWRRFLESLAAQQPLVLVFEDLHWADPALLDFIDHLLDPATASPLLVVCTARPELYAAREGWGGGKRNAATLSLAPLSAEETDRLVTDLLAEHRLPPELQQELLARSGHNPLFAEQFVRMVRERGLDEDDNGAAIPVPETIQALIEARLDTLPADRKELLEDAAVVGTIFWSSAVASMSGLDEPAVADLLQELAWRELVRRTRFSSVEGQDEYCFWHSLVRDVAYGRIPRAARADKHIAAAGWTEGLTADGVGHEEILGYHLEQAHRCLVELRPVDDSETGLLATRAAQILAGAGRRAMRGRDEPAAVNLLGRAAALLRSDDPARREILPDLGSALMRTGDFKSADAVLTEALEAAAAAGDRRLELRTLIERAFCRTYTDPEGAIEETLRVAEEAIPELEALGDEFALAKAWWLKSEAYVNECRWGARAEALERAVEHAGRAGDSREEGTLVGLLAQSLYYGPTPVPEAIRRCEEFLPAAGRDRSLEAGISSALAGLYAMRGDFPEARRLWARSSLMYEELGQNFRRAGRSLIGATIELLAGNPEEAVRVLTAGYDTLAEMGEKSVRSTLAAFLADALCVLGRYEEAERFSEISEQTAASDDRVTQIVWRGARAKVLARRGESEEAERLARSAVELADETDFLDVQAGALLGLAEVLVLAGSSPVDPLLERARGIYEQKGNLVGARNVGEPTPAG